MSELSEPLRQAVEYIRRSPPPPDSVLKALERAQALPNTPGKSFRPLVPVFVGLGLAATVLIALGLWLTQPTDSWADVARAVQAKPWVHATAKFGDDTRELWFSPTRQVSATKSRYDIMFYDQRLAILHSYEPDKKVLYRVPDTFNNRQREFRAFQDTLQDLFHGELAPRSPLSHGEVIEQKQQRVTDGGKTWQEHTLSVRLSQERDGPEARLVFRVDPASRLPHSMTMIPVPRGQDDRRPSVTLTFDYPDKGPVDIFDLGVPRDATLVDRVPADDLNRLLTAVRAGRERLQPYRAVAVVGDDRSQESRWNGHAYLVWHSGLKWRVERHYRYPPKHDAAWWWKLAEKTVYWDLLGVCDGRSVQWRTIDNGELKIQLKRRLPSDATIYDSLTEALLEAEGRDIFPELLAYPDLPVPSQQFEARLDTKPKDGPPGTVLLTVQLTSRTGPHNEANVYKDHRYWMDPTRGYVTLRQEMRTRRPGEPGADDPKLSRLIETVAEKLERSPMGVWYVASASQAIWRPNGKTEKSFRYYLDFQAPLGDELFKPAERTSHVGHGDDKTTSHDLGEIQPPRGVPLIGAGEAINVEAMNKVRKRLEAAPTEDLEKWVVELERIMDQKLDGELAKQGCRTYFVTRVSVAFDDWKWKAQIADKLFQRAQTLPASEAKVWKEAFEALLKKEIGQTDDAVLDGGPAYDVPLVLIPVDALHEGQKYSVERGKKYLARLKQLTADDVSLWRDKVDQFGGRALDAAVNIILLDDFFDNERFQREKLKAAIEARKK
jgi:hypothetical protein